ncbi:MAG: phenylalanine--tRNA ligase subunit alpha, partial [Bacteroidota bacterium]
MKEKIEDYRREIENYTAGNFEELESFRIKYLSKKGLIPALFADFRNVPNEQKKEMGQQLNQLKQLVQQRIAAIRDELQAKEQEIQSCDDLSLPVGWRNVGSRHPVSVVKNQINEIFKKIGFTVAEGPEIEDDFHNFSALNFPAEHPARDMQDTFFIEKDPDIALRTHTSSVQVRVMESTKPPIRIIAPGRVFRNEAISARAHCIFHQ